MQKSSSKPAWLQPTSIKNLHVVRTLNKGAFAEVYEAVENATGKPVALKVVRTKLVIGF